jgi:hypothetical protein
VFSYTNQPCFWDIQITYGPPLNPVWNMTPLTAVSGQTTLHGIDYNTPSTGPILVLFENITPDIRNQVYQAVSQINSEESCVYVL